MGAKFLSRIEKLGTDGQTAGQCFRKKSKIALTFYFPSYTDLTFFKRNWKKYLCRMFTFKLGMQTQKRQF